MQYFQHTKTYGVSNIWTWLFVFWLTVLGWIMAQLLITSPIEPIVRLSNPNLADDLLRIQESSLSETDLPRLRAAVSAFMLSTLIGLIIGMMVLSGSLKRYKRGLKIISAIAMAISFFSLATLAPLTSSAEGTQVLNQILAVSPASYALVLLTFPAALTALYLGQTYVLKRSLLSLHTSFLKFRWARCTQAILVTWAVLGGLSALLHFTGYKTLALTFDPSRFFIYAAISLTLIPLQAATEEIIFRGYLNQAIENISGNKWFAFLVTSLLFMSLHLSNPEALSGAEAGTLPLVMSSYFFFGFAACLLLLIDDGLESAIGLHVANNLFAAIFVNYENSVLPTPSVFQIKTSAQFDSLLLIFTLGLIVLTLYALRSKPAAQTSSSDTPSNQDA